MRVPLQLQQTNGRQLAGQLSGPLRHFLATESGSALVLVVATAVALLWANSPWSAGYTATWETAASVQLGALGLEMSIGHWISDGLMVLFFFVIGLEVRRDLAIGELTDRSRVVLPLLAGFGGMLVPALLFLLIAPSGEAAAGWGVVIGTDTAFLLGTLALVGPSISTQLRVFLLTLTVVDDIVAVSVIGVFYARSIDMVALAVALVGILALVLLARLGVWRTWPYVLTTLLVWLATIASGVHASIAGMVCGLLIPAFSPRREVVKDAAISFRAFRQSPLPESGRSARDAVARAVSVNERMQLVLHPWTGYVVVPLFALANAGVDLRGGVFLDALTAPLTWAVVVGLVIGKFVGIGGGALAGARLRLGRLPQGVGPGQVLGGAALSGIGFTVSLLIIGLAFESPRLRAEATIGVLLSLVIATALGWVTFQVAARWHGETSAGLPTVLSRPVDPARDHILGPVDAPLTLVEYADFECPFCAKATGVAREVREHYGDRLRYVFRHLTLPEVHPHAELAAAAAEAAGAQGRFWEMNTMLFAHADELELQDLAGYAGQLGLDVEDFLRDIDEQRHAARIREDVASAEESGARGTPTFFIGSQRHVGPWDAQSLIEALDAVAVPDAAQLP
ncbi:MAG TPA: Na+/H+ antiporter NhaA [Propionicimonas sp.]|nr:Na+/H+ antiporter NhaA [Propionicimonas sp.]